MRRLVESWVAAEKALGNILATAIKRLNEKLGMRVTHSRVSEWRKGIYVPTPLVISYLLHRSLRWELNEVGIEITAAQFNQLSELLWMPIEVNGEVGVELL